MSPAVLQGHINVLALELGCQMIQQPNMAGMMYVEYEPPLIDGPTIEDQKDYFIMLHELGHVFHGHTQGRPPWLDRTYYFDNGVLRSEAEAWEWALDNAIEDPTSATRLFITEKCILTYYSSSLRDGYERDDCRLYNGNRHHVSFRWDKPDDYFWNVVRRMNGET